MYHHSVILQPDTVFFNQFFLCWIVDFKVRQNLFLSNSNRRLTFFWHLLGRINNRLPPSFASSAFGSICCRARCSYILFALTWAGTAQCLFSSGVIYNLYSCFCYLIKERECVVLATFASSKLSKKMVASSSYSDFKCGC